MPSRLGSAIKASDGLIRVVGQEPGGRVAGGGLRRTSRAEVSPDRESGGRDRRARRTQARRRPARWDRSGGGPGRRSRHVRRPGRLDGRTIVILSDGEDHAGTWPQAIARLRSQRIAVHAVAFGDDDRGAPVPGDANGVALNYHGRDVVSRRSDLALKAVATATGGAFLPAGRSRIDLATLYRDRIAPAEKRLKAATRPPDRTDRFAWPLTAALGWMASFSRPRSRRWIAWTAFLAIGLGAAPPWTSARKAAEDGDRAYAERRYSPAFEAYDAAARLEPSSSIASYNAAAALFQLGRFPEAKARYVLARKTASPSLRAKIDYALGNTEAALGRYKEAIPHYDACLSAEDARSDPVSLKPDARINRAFATARLPPSTTPDESGDRTAKAPPPRPRAGDSQADPRPPASGESPPDPPSDSAPRSPSASPSGASGKTSPERSPNADLDTLLSQVRKAQAARGDDRPPGSSSRPDQKDW